MAGRVIELLLNNPGSSFFFAFGAGHFVGDNTILDVVRKAGFVVEPVHDADDLENWSRSTVVTNGKYHSLLTTSLPLSLFSRVRQAKRTGRRRHGQGNL